MIIITDLIKERLHTPCDIGLTLEKLKSKFKDYNNFNWEYINT
jgi:hypothetical protein